MKLFHENMFLELMTGDGIEFIVKFGSMVLIFPVILALIFIFGTSVGIFFWIPSIIYYYFKE